MPTRDREIGAETHWINNDSVTDGSELLHLFDTK
jgi:hypothetical protein